MEGIRTWGASLCCAAVVCAVLQLLAPGGGVGRILELIGAAVFLCCALSPLVTLPQVDWKSALSAPLSSSAQSELLQTRIQEQIGAPLQQAVAEEGTAALSSYGLEAEKIEAVMDTGEDGGIYITKIVATITKKQAVRQTAVAQILEKRFGVDVEVKVLE